MPNYALSIFIFVLDVMENHVDLFLIKKPLNVGKLIAN